MKGNCLALLSERGTLTGLITQLMGQEPVLNCLMQGKGFVSPVERQQLNIEPRVYSHIREITMGTPSELWMFARTVIPLETLRGSAKRLAKIDKKPIGKILFGRNGAIRKTLQVERIDAEEANLDRFNLAQFNIDKCFRFWQRRSIFQLETGPLMICETFLPSCPIYSND